jgi:ADP-heptose:LPS heptosyltransferase
VKSVSEQFKGFIITLLGFFFMIIRTFKRSDSHHQKLILVICLHRIGDTLFTVPAIKQLLSQNMEVRVLIFSPLMSVLKKIFDKNIFIELEKKSFLFNNKISNSKSRKLIKKLDPEIIVDLTGSITSASLIFNAPTKKIFGMNSEFFRSIYSGYIPVRNLPHLMDRYCDVVSLLNIPDKNNYKISSLTINKINKILIHPFAGWKAKEWSLRSFIKLAGKLKEEYFVTLVCERNNIQDDVLAFLQEQRIPFVYTDTLEMLTDEIESCSLFIGNDSGPLYIAAALGKPTFTIYGPTNPDYSIPLGNHHKYFRKLVPCSPGHDNQYCFTNAGRSGCPAFQCMNNASFEEVYLSVKNFIKNISLINNNNNNEL